MALNEIIKEAIKIPALYWYVAPTYRQAKEIAWKDPQMLFKFLPRELIKSRNEVELTVYLNNGAIISLKGADNPDSLRGTNPLGVVFDEYGDIANRWGAEVWEAVIQPILIGNNGWAWFIGTPKGVNHFHQLFSKERPNWQAFNLKASESGILTREQLEDARLNTTQAFFAQEYECAWAEGAGQFFRRVEENIHTDNIGTSGIFQVGVDLGKYNDYTVITPLRLNDFKVGEIERFNQIDWAIQKPRIEAAVRRYNNARTWIDSTGAGEPIFEDLSRAGLPIEGYKFSESSLEQLLRNLAILFEQDKIKIPRYEILINELRGIRLELNDRGQTKIISQTEHDDCVMSLALACWGITDPLGDNENIEYNLYGSNFS